ncbi:MAG: hypothetical protein A3H59_00225 [Candidatus Jacksonbacteria bacterium RIFCSPLOWO2_02_FULL_43_9]|nr:MAG: hypothetical protein UV70_C0011G0072 [Parcubacteria group bacterium GW2011_GWA2_43_13]OGY69723.1 MAG: hypothetical protein A3B94_00340 [Candidatus Jacksonbacteria bacterium RIFCSPHIGHO2_02_FULL_43_10]OGY71454.1 MAG: hypothetical protein A2986_03870 [Candidatus Jacksonbacteria bacterium RIFCSPLOWO2_01_FULL_44_13]OGY72115.1 MAG: hypothetical protein A3H59_00225 [Candidatus Jacksonbacteria bacterium RIFCSPLOWO2_02_FULL_43_9]HAZ16648.1 hypothetical protein [Candidatus Jacksonbacteria bacter
MIRKHQRILVFGFSLLFFITAPLVLLYGTGFRFDTRTFEFVETGSFVIRSYPKDISIEADGKPTGKTTPAVLSHLLPGIHHIRLQSPEFSVWEKDVYIYPKMTTFAENIQLFPAIPMEGSLSTETQPHLFFPSHRLRYAIEVKKQTASSKLILKNLQESLLQETEKTITTLAKGEELRHLSWAKSEKKIVLTTSSRAMVFMISRDDSPIDIKKILNFLPESCSWHPFDDTLLLCERKQELWLIDIALSRPAHLYTGEYGEFRIDEYELFLPVIQPTNSDFIAEKNNTTKDEMDESPPPQWTLLAFDLKDTKLQPRTLMGLPLFSEDAEFKVVKNYYSLYIPSRKQWFLAPRTTPVSYNASMPVFSFTSEQVEHITWNGDHTKALYITNETLWYLDVAFDQFVPPIELSQLKDAVQSLVWMPGDRHGLVIYPLSIDVVETDLHTPPMTRTLVKRAQPITPIEPMTDGKWLYTGVSDGAHPGIVRFRIRP